MINRETRISLSLSYQRKILSTKINRARYEVIYVKNVWQMMFDESRIAITGISNETIYRNGGGGIIS